MKKRENKFKNWVSYAVGGLLLFLMSLVCYAIALEYSKPQPDGSSTVKVTFGTPVWNGTYCTFPNLQITSSDPNFIRTIQISYSGNDTQNANITAPSVPSGFTADPDDTTTMATFTTTQTVPQVQAFLRTIQYHCNTSQSVTILLGKSTIPNDVHYFPGTGHFYKYVPDKGISWVDAYKAALKSNIGGWQGYLAVITSKEEDDFYKNMLLGMVILQVCGLEVQTIQH